MMTMEKLAEAKEQVKGLEGKRLRQGRLLTDVGNVRICWILWEFRLRVMRHCVYV